MLLKLLKLLRLKLVSLGSAQGVRTAFLLNAVRKNLFPYFIQLLEYIPYIPRLLCPSSIFKQQDVLLQTPHHHLLLKTISLPPLYKDTYDHIKSPPSPYLDHICRVPFVI